MISLSDSYLRVPLDQITVLRDTRQRKSIDVSDLLGSIRQRGVLNPVILSPEYELVAGERRLEASRQLGLADIPVRFTNQIPLLELQIIELEENLKRKDLDWKDQTEAIQRIHQLYCQQSASWTQEQTAEAISLTPGMISMYLAVAKEMPQGKIQGATTVREAYNTLKRQDQRKAGEALEELAGAFSGEDAKQEEGAASSGQQQGSSGQASRPVSPPPTDILNLSFLDWAPSYAGPKFNLVHCDFPYGIDLFSGPQGRGADRQEGYADQKDVYFTLLESFCLHLDRFMSLSSHLMFWYSAKYHFETMDFFAKHAPSLEFSPYPLVWGKSDNAGIAGDAKRDFRHTYETCLFATRGGRNLVGTKGDWYSAPTDRSLHPSTKPEPMLRHFMSALVDDSTNLLDPTCGSGAALRAAESLGSQRVLGLEIDQDHYRNALAALRESRLKRRASESLESL